MLTLLGTLLGIAAGVTLAWYSPRLFPAYPKGTYVKDVNLGLVGKYQHRTTFIFGYHAVLVTADVEMPNNTYWIGRTINPRTTSLIPFDEQDSDARI